MPCSHQQELDLCQKQCELGLKEHKLISVSVTYYVNVCWCHTNAVPYVCEYDTTICHFII